MHPFPDPASFAPSWVRRLVDTDGFMPVAGQAIPVDSAVLVADITGFTPLADRLAALGPAGAEELSRQLSAYLEQLVALVEVHGGDVLKFAGDALIAQWPIGNGDGANAVQLAAACGLAIQSTLHLYRIEGGNTTLSLRVAVMRWRASALLLESGGQTFGTLLGVPFDEVASALSFAQPGDVILSPEAWASIVARAQASPVNQGFWRLGQVDDALPRQSASAPTALVEETPRPPPPAGNCFEPFVPEPAREALAAGYADWLGELRQVSVVFVRLGDLERPQTQLEDTLQEHLARLEPIVRRCGGYVREFGADDKGFLLVAVFGLPPHGPERAAARATRAALALHSAVRDADCFAAVGVSTGRCFCGVVGSDLWRDYVVIGDVMNIASRLMESAGHGTAGAEVICDASTQDTALPYFEFQQLADLLVKGKPVPLRVATPMQEAQPQPVAHTTLVGRQDECLLAQELIASCAVGLESGVLMVQGEPGIGKTRLIAAITQQALAAGLHLLSGAADAMEDATPYYVWRRPLMAMLGNTPAEVLQGLGPARVGRAPLLEAVLAMGLPETPETLPLSGSQRATATRELLLELFAEAAMKAPLAFVLEDGHWIDSSSWQLVLEVARRLPKVLLVLSTRPFSDPEPAPMAELRSLPHTRVLPLSTLTDAETIALVCSKLGVASLPSTVQEVICSRAGGLPLYAEELATSLLDSGVIKVEKGCCLLRPGVDPSTLVLPETLQAVMGSRLDRLKPREALVLKVCSVLGTSIDAALLSEVYPMRDDRQELPALLDKLVQSGFLIRQAEHPSLVFAFRHVLMREVAYSYLLFAQRSQLHRAVAEWYETSSSDEKPELFSVRAHHWSQAGVVEKAVTCFEKCASRSFALGMARAAVDHGLEAARLLDVHLPTDPLQIKPLLVSELARIEQMRGGREREELLKMPSLQDERVGRVVNLLLRIMPFSHVSLQGELFALMALRCMTLTHLHGSGPMTPVVYAMYSIVYRGLTGDGQAACSFAEMALELDARQGGALKAQVGFIYTWFHQHWFYPLESALPLIAEAADAGLARQDVTYACFNLATYVIYLAALGRNLSEVIRVARHHFAQIDGRVYSPSFHCLLELQLAKALAGLTTNPTSLTDSEYHDELELGQVCSTDHYNQIGFYHLGRLKLFYWFGHYPKALKAADDAKSLLPSFSGQIAEAELMIFHSLALIAHARDSDLRQAELLRQEARVMLMTIERWAALNASNFRHVVLLLQAELLNDLSLYGPAATAASTAGFRHYAALTHELQARALRAKHEPAWRTTLERALLGYRDWGAEAKVRQLELWASTSAPNQPSAITPQQ